MLSIFSQDKITADKLWGLGRINLEDVSADGKYVVYSVTRYDMLVNKGFTDLFLLDLVTATSTQLTNTPDVSESNALFRPETKKVGFLRGGALYEVNYEGTGETKITPDGMTWGGFKYSPIGTHIIAVQELKFGKDVKERYADLPKADVRVYDDLMYRHWKTWEDNIYNNLVLYNYAEGQIIDKSGKNIMNEAFDCPSQPNGGIEEIAWTPKGKAIAYTCKKLSGKEYATSTNSEVYLYDIATQNTYNLSQGNPGYDREPFAQLGGSWMCWHSLEKAGNEADRSRLMRFSLSEWGKKEELTIGFDNDAEHAKSTKEGHLYFIGGDNGTKQIFKWDNTSRQITQLTKGVFDYVNFMIGDNCLIAARQSMSSPTELYKINLSNGEAEQLTFVNRELLTTIKMGEVKRKMVKTTDNKEMNVWMIYPPDFDPSKKYPTLLYCQGGPQSALSQFWSYRWNFQLMAANGYIVIAPCRRGMPTFGRAWNDQISGDWGGQCMKDYLSAVDTLKKEPGVDANKLGAVGASFGGYSVYWLAGNHQKRFKCFISHCGMFNTESWYGTTEELFFANNDLGGPYWENPSSKSYNEFSPHNYVKNWDTPIMVIHGELDFRVPVSEGLQAYQAARLKGIPARLLTFPNEGHWITSPQNSMVWQREFFAWLDKYLKG